MNILTKRVPNAARSCLGFALALVSVAAIAATTPLPERVQVTWAPTET